jgi:hypothetical protein
VLIHHLLRSCHSLERVSKIEKGLIIYKDTKKAWNNQAFIYIF